MKCVENIVGSSVFTSGPRAAKRRIGRQKIASAISVTYLIIECLRGATRSREKKNPEMYSRIPDGMENETERNETRPSFD